MKEVLQDLINELEKLKNFPGVDGATMQLAIDLIKQKLNYERRLD